MGLILMKDAKRQHILLFPHNWLVFSPLAHPTIILRCRKPRLEIVGCERSLNWFGPHFFQQLAPKTWLFGKVSRQDSMLV